jgi:hypothetical protein
MSNLTIIVDDNAVYLDGAVLDKLDLTSAGIPSNVHALQWKTNIGWIEFRPNADFSHDPNQIINALPDWANTCVNIFNNQVQLNKNAAAAAAEAAKNNQPKTTGTTVV